MARPIWGRWLRVEVANVPVQTLSSGSSRDNLLPQAHAKDKGRIEQRA